MSYVLGVMGWAFHFSFEKVNQTIPVFNGHTTFGGQIICL